ncbi:MAG: class I SAM-dependent DNA methyltransferase [Candidatus Pacearchaeota archaeon]
MVKNNNKGDLGFEQKLWLSADKLRSNMDASEYKHVVLGLIFLKYISDAFREVYDEIKNDPQGDPEDVDEYKAKNIFWVPKDARWEKLQSNAKQPKIGTIIDDAMDAIEKENPSLKGVLPKDYARPALDKQRLGELIDLIGSIALGDKENRSKDVLGRVYEYFLGQFADAEGKKGGQFYTPRCIVKLLVEMLEPYKGRIFDPCCGSGGMFVQSEKFVESHGGRIGDISVYGQESNQTTWKLCKMNLAIRGIDSDIQWNSEGSFLNDAHRDLKADFILANPPFNDSDWKGEQLKEDIRWKYGVPPTGNANFGWVQHFIHHLAPHGTAGFVLANGSLSSNTGGEGEIRKNIIEADLVDCIVAMPSQLFYNTMIPACLWFVSKDKKNHKFRDREGEFLFIDARKHGVMIDRRHKDLTDEEVKRISETYHAWRGEGGKYEDVAGFCKSVKLEEIEKHGYVLTAGRYVGTEEVEEDPEVFNEKMERLTKELGEQFKESEKLEEEIKENLKSIGWRV